jgi:hypothetical protein
MGKYLFLLVLLISVNSIYQNVNDFKYAIVPTKFDFLKD